jgi:hypothetical protein
MLCCLCGVLLIVVENGMMSSAISEIGSVYEYRYLVGYKYQVQDRQVVVRGGVLFDRALDFRKITSSYLLVRTYLV